MRPRYLPRNPNYPTLVDLTNPSYHTLVGIPFVFLPPLADEVRKLPLLSQAPLDAIFYPYRGMDYFSQALNNVRNQIEKEKRIIVYVFAINKCVKSLSDLIKKIYNSDSRFLPPTDCDLEPLVYVDYIDFFSIASVLEGLYYPIVFIKFIIGFYHVLNYLFKERDSIKHIVDDPSFYLHIEVDTLNLSIQISKKLISLPPIVKALLAGPISYDMCPLPVKHCFYRYFFSNEVKVKKVKLGSKTIYVNVPTIRLPYFIDFSELIYIYSNFLHTAVETLKQNIKVKTNSPQKAVKYTRDILSTFFEPYTTSAFIPSEGKDFLTGVNFYNPYVEFETNTDLIIF